MNARSIEKGELVLIAVLKDVEISIVRQAELIFSDFLQRILY